MPVCFPDQAGKPYRPSNGTEGLIFESLYCDKCEHDRKFRETEDGKYACKVLCDSMICKIDEPGYPKEWIYDENGNPTCTKFKPEKKSDDTYHSEHEDQLELTF